jgi:hypothetical protein
MGSISAFRIPVIARRVQDIPAALPIRIPLDNG